MYAQFNSFEIRMTLQDARCMTHSGSCDYDVNHYLTNNKPINRQLNAIGPNKIRDELKEYGAWDEQDLKDDKANRERIVWIAAGNITDGHTGMKG